MKRFIISDRVSASACAAFNNETVKMAWKGFTFTRSRIETDSSLGQANAFVIGNVPVPELPSDAEYAYRVCECGVAIRAKDHPSLMRGYFDLLMQIEYDADGTLYIEEKEAVSHFTLKMRMIHFCAFNQTRLFELKKLIRLAASLGYTHAVIEFWGMFPYECCPELAWDEAYTKDEVRALAKEMHELGIEPVPMINHLGHATACRLNGGKHVALDRSPLLYRYFTPDGWSWDVASPEVRELLKKMRRELYDVFGEGGYFHIGLDEAYMYAMSPKHKASLPEYLSYLTNEVVSEGRRPMIWMDMFLPAASGTPHICTCKNDEEMLLALNSLNKKTILVDWEYYGTKTPFPTTEYIAKRNVGLDIMCAPWTKRDNFEAAVNTVNELGIFGFMMTTWHTMVSETPTILIAARMFGAPKAPWSDFSGSEGLGGKEECATLIRKLSFEGVRSYRDSGWCDEEILLNVGDLRFL